MLRTVLYETQKLVLYETKLVLSFNNFKNEKKKSASKLPAGADGGLLGAQGRGPQEGQRKLEEREKQRVERGSRRRETKRKVQMREKRSGSERKRDNEIRLRREREDGDKRI